MAEVTKCKALAVSIYFRSKAVNVISAKQHIRAAVLNWAIGNTDPLKLVHAIEIAQSNVLFLCRGSLGGDFIFRCP